MRVKPQNNSLIARIRVSTINPIVISLMLSSVVIGCNDNATNLSVLEQRKPDIVAVGVYHNKGLDHMLSYFKSHVNVGKTSINEFVQMAKSSALDFTMKVHPNLTSSDRDKMARDIQSVTKMFDKYISNNSGRISTESIQGTLTALSPYMTALQRTHINSIFDALDQLENDITALDLRLNQIETSVYSNMLSGEAEPILAATSIARNSAYYWNANMYEWQQLVDPNNDDTLYPARTQGKISWSGVAKMDVAGAVTWGVATGVGALLTGPIGWGYWIGSTLLAGVVSSGAMAVIYLVTKTMSDTQTNGFSLDNDLREIHIPEIN